VHDDELSIPVLEIIASNIRSVSYDPWIRNPLLNGYSYCQLTRSSIRMQRDRACDVPQIRNVALEKACDKGVTFKGH